MNICVSPLAVAPLTLRWPAAAAGRSRELAVGLIGPGRVGSALLAQLRAAQPRLARETGLQLQLCGVAARRKMWLDCDDPLLNHAGCGPHEQRAQIWRPGNLDEFAAHIRGNDGRHALLIDCSASDEVTSHYAGWLASGIHVVTPNKLAGSGSLVRWQAIHNACAAGTRFRYEATVCAGLPVVQTLRDLLDTGDELVTVEGMFSGTLGWLCNRYDGQQPFSALVREAHALGYTEPDPRDDLSGLDVARKLVILAREAGWSLSLDNVEVRGLVPAKLAALTLDECMAQLHELDQPMAAQLAQARAAGGVLRHVAQLDRHGHASVGLKVMPAAHSFAHTRLTDNMVQFTTRRYCDNPLSVQGPGAGPEVTAAGVFADVLRIADSLQARA
ncbi:MAG: homoserine dehydrogenase [Rhodanobacter sp.]